MLQLTKKLSLMVSMATLVVVIGYGSAPSQIAFATPSSPATISARIMALSGLALEDISEMYAVEQAAKIVIIASDINIPIVVEPKVVYLLIKNAVTGAWIRLIIDLAEWNADFPPYFGEHGVEIHQQPSGTIASLTPDQEAAQISAVATMTGTVVAGLVLSIGDSDGDGVSDNIDGFPSDVSPTEAEFVATADATDFSFSMMLRLVCSCALGSTIEHQIDSEPWTPYVKPLVFDQTTTVSARIHSQGANGLVQTKTYTRTLIVN